MMRSSWMPAAILGLFLAAGISWGQPSSPALEQPIEPIRVPCDNQPIQLLGCSERGVNSACLALENPDTEAPWIAFLVADSLNLWNLFWSLGHYEAAQAMAEEACQLEPGNLAAEHARVLSQVVNHPGFAEAVRSAVSARRRCQGAPCSSGHDCEARDRCSTSCQAPSSQCVTQTSNRCAQENCARDSQCSGTCKTAACASSCSCAKKTCNSKCSCACKTAACGSSCSCANKTCDSKCACVCKTAACTSSCSSAKKTCACGPNCTCAKGTCACGPHCPCKASRSRTAGTKSPSRCCPCEEISAKVAPPASCDDPQERQLLQHLLANAVHPYAAWQVFPLPPPPAPPLGLPPGHPMVEFCQPGLPCPAMMAPPWAQWAEGAGRPFPGQPPHPLCGRAFPPHVYFHPAVRRTEGFVPPHPAMVMSGPEEKPVRVTARGSRIHISTPHFKATCNSLSYQESSDRMVLEGGVRMTLLCGPRSGKIIAERVVAGVHENFFEVLPASQPQTPSANPLNTSGYYGPTTKPSDKEDPTCPENCP